MKRKRIATNEMMHDHSTKKGKMPSEQRNIVKVLYEPDGSIEHKTEIF